MSENKSLKSNTTIFNEKAQYLLAFGIIASMLMVATMPVFVIFFFAVFAYMVYKMISSGATNYVRQIFEFYLSANEILKNDSSKWFAFEVNEVIEKGEKILLNMAHPPPLVYFTLGVMYNKSGDHKNAIRHLSNVLENPAADESAYAYPTPELLNYVKVLRSIERRPAEAPLTFAAIRALERTRKTRGKALLEESRTKLAQNDQIKVESNETAERTFTESDDHQYSLPKGNMNTADHYFIYDEADTGNDKETIYNQLSDRKVPTDKRNESKDRKSISEVLHDIYDKNVQ